MDLLSASEMTAEKIYNLLRTGRMGKRSFTENFVNLANREDKDGVYYLTWLLAKSDNKYVEDLLLKAIKRI